MNLGTSSGECLNNIPCCDSQLTSWPIIISSQSSTWINWRDSTREGSGVTEILAARYKSQENLPFLRSQSYIVWILCYCNWAELGCNLTLLSNTLNALSRGHLSCVLAPCLVILPFWIQHNQTQNIIQQQTLLPLNNTINAASHEIRGCVFCWLY